MKKINSGNNSNESRSIMKKDMKVMMHDVFIKLIYMNWTQHEWHPSLLDLFFIGKTSILYLLYFSHANWFNKDTFYKKKRYEKMMSNIERDSNLVITGIFLKPKFIWIIQNHLPTYRNSINSNSINQSLCWKKVFLNVCLFRFFRIIFFII